MVNGVPLEAGLEAFSRPVNVAERLLEKHPPGSFKSLEHLARRLGIRVDYVESLPWKASGFAGVDEDGLPYIAVNSRRDQVHQEVTIAEEIGHHVLGHHEQAWRAPYELDDEAKLFACTMFMHHEVGVSIEEYCRRNPDMDTMIYAPLFVKALPTVVSIVRMAGESLGRFAEIKAGFSKRLPSIRRFLLTIGSTPLPLETVADPPNND